MTILTAALVQFAANASAYVHKAKDQCLVHHQRTAVLKPSGRYAPVLRSEAATDTAIAREPHRKAANTWEASEGTHPPHFHLPRVLLAVAKSFVLHQGQENQKGGTYRNTSEARQEWKHSPLLCGGPARSAKFSASLIQRLTTENHVLTGGWRGGTQDAPYELAGEATESSVYASDQNIALGQEVRLLQCWRIAASSLSGWVTSRDWSPHMYRKGAFPSLKIIWGSNPA